MAILRGGGWNEGSLLRRTLLHIGTFAIGALIIVAILSFTLTSIAKSLLPSHAAKAVASAAPVADAPDEEGAGATLKATPKVSRSKKPRGVIVEEESPTRDTEK